MCELNLSWRGKCPVLKLLWGHWHPASRWPNLGCSRKRSGMILMPCISLVNQCPVTLVTSLVIGQPGWHSWEGPQYKRKRVAATQGHKLLDLFVWVAEYALEEILDMESCVLCNTPFGSSPYWDSGVSTPQLSEQPHQWPEHPTRSSPTGSKECLPTASTVVFIGAAAPVTGAPYKEQPDQ